MAMNQGAVKETSPIEGALMTLNHRISEVVGLVEKLEDKLTSVMRVVPESLGPLPDGKNVTVAKLPSPLEGNINGISCTAEKLTESLRRILARLEL